MAEIEAGSPAVFFILYISRSQLGSEFSRPSCMMVQGNLLYSGSTLAVYTNGLNTCPVAAKSVFLYPCRTGKICVRCADPKVSSGIIFIYLKTSIKRNLKLYYLNHALWDCFVD